MIDRFIHSDNGSLADFSVQVEDYHAGSTNVTIVAGQDAIYLGSRFPFNSRYFKVATANVAAATPTVAYWDGNKFQPVVELTDETSAAGVPLAQSGHLTWTTNRDFGWALEDTTEDIPELANLVIYDQYWIKITFSADVTADIAWAGHMFGSDEDIGSEYPDLLRANFKTAFESGKTDWEEQRVRASKLILDDLVNANLLRDGNQLLERREMRYAMVSKTAVLIYSAMGDDYVDDVLRSQKEYTGRFKKSVLSIDRNNNANLDRGEVGVKNGWLFR